jgi:hypothetical protein
MTARANTPMPTISTLEPPLANDALGSVEMTSGTVLVRGLVVVRPTCDGEAVGGGGDEWLPGGTPGGTLCAAGGGYGFELVAGRCDVTPSTPSDVGTTAVGVSVSDGGMLLNVRLGTSVNVSVAVSLGDGVPAGLRVEQGGGVGVSEPVGASDDVVGSWPPGEFWEMGEPDSVGVRQVGVGLDGEDESVGASDDVGAPDGVDVSDEVGALGDVDAGASDDWAAGTARNVEPLAAGVSSQDEPVAKTAAASSTATIVERDTVSAPPAAETSD